MNIVNRDISKYLYTVVLQEGEQIFTPIICLTLEDAITTRKKIFTKYCKEKNIKIANPDDFSDYEKAIWVDNIERINCYIFESCVNKKEDDLKYRMIVLNNNEVDMTEEEYVNSQEKVLDIKTNNLHYVWELMINKFEGMNYCILANNKLLCSGSFDPSDYEIIEDFERGLKNN